MSQFWKESQLLWCVVLISMETQPLPSPGLITLGGECQFVVGNTRECLFMEIQSQRKHVFKCEKTNKIHGKTLFAIYINVYVVAVWCQREGGCH